MMVVEKSAKTKEEAIALALEELGIEEEQAQIEVVEEGSKGFLGFGSKMAVVKVRKKLSEKKSEKSKGCCSGECADKAKEFLSKIFELTGEDVTVDTVSDGDVLRVNLSGPDMGIVIGKRGETLDALQHLTSLAVNKGDCGFMKISLDAENYREKRNEALESLAGKLANKVMRTRRSTTLEPMNAYERRIIHSALQDHEFVTTYSIGQGINRKVVIALKQK
ncbi:MAG: protein jag [Ruminococcaceae bacterium]|nr:protein jag [Oscillospiraceae bacterium]